MKKIVSRGVVLDSLLHLSDKSLGLSDEIVDACLKNPDQIVGDFLKETGKSTNEKSIERALWLIFLNQFDVPIADKSQWRIPTFQPKAEELTSKSRCMIWLLSHRGIETRKPITDRYWQIIIDALDLKINIKQFTAIIEGRETDEAYKSSISQHIGAILKRRDIPDTPEHIQYVMKVITQSPLLKGSQGPEFKAKIMWEWEAIQAEVLNPAPLLKAESLLPNITNLLKSNIIVRVPEYRVDEVFRKILSKTEALARDILHSLKRLKPDVIVVYDKTLKQNGKCHGVLGEIAKAGHAELFREVVAEIGGVPTKSAMGEKDSEEMTLVDAVVLGGSVALLTYLEIEDLELQNEGVLGLALESGSPEMVLQCLSLRDRGSLQIDRDKKGNTLLMQAIKGEDSKISVDIARTLHQSMGDTYFWAYYAKIENAKRETALSLAITTKQRALVKILGGILEPKHVQALILSGDLNFIEAVIKDLGVSRDHLITRYFEYVAKYAGGIILSDLKDKRSLERRQWLFKIQSGSEETRAHQLIKWAPGVLYGILEKCSSEHISEVLLIKTKYGGFVLAHLLAYMHPETLNTILKYVILPTKLQLLGLRFGGGSAVLSLLLKYSTGESGGLAGTQTVEELGQILSNRVLSPLFLGVFSNRNRPLEKYIKNSSYENRVMLLSQRIGEKSLAEVYVEKDSEGFNRILESCTFKKEIEDILNILNRKGLYLKTILINTQRALLKEILKHHTHEEKWHVLCQKRQWKLSDIDNAFNQWVQEWVGIDLSKEGVEELWAISTMGEKIMMIGNLRRAPKEVSDALQKKLEEWFDNKWHNKVEPLSTKDALEGLLELQKIGGWEEIACAWMTECLLRSVAMLDQCDTIAQKIKILGQKVHKKAGISEEGDTVANVLIKSGQSLIVEEILGDPSCAAEAEALIRASITAKEIGSGEELSVEEDYEIFTDQWVEAWLGEEDSSGDSGEDSSKDPCLGPCKRQRL